MSRFAFLQPVSESGLLRLADVDLVVQALRGDGLAVLPTETGYALAAAATSHEALLRAFAVKERDHAHPMHVACASLDMAERYAAVSDDARRLLGRWTPGPLTVVVPQTAALDDELVTYKGTIGIRVPDHPATLQVIARLGVPVTATSLNRTGEERLPVTEEMLDGLPWADLTGVPVVVDSAAMRHEAASTLVRLVGDEVAFLRDGPVSHAEVLATLGRG